MKKSEKVNLFNIDSLPRTIREAWEKSQNIDFNGLCLRFISLDKNLAFTNRFFWSLSVLPLLIIIIPFIRTVGREHLVFCAVGLVIYSIVSFSLINRSGRLAAARDEIRKKFSDAEEGLKADIISVFGTVSTATIKPGHDNLEKAAHHRMLAVAQHLLLAEENLFKIARSHEKKGLETALAGATGWINTFRDQLKLGLPACKRLGLLNEVTKSNLFAEAENSLE